MESLTELASQTISVLTPFIPVLINSAVAKTGEAIPSAIGKLWNAVQNRLRGHAAAEEAIRDIITDPKDEDNIASLRKELRKAMEIDSSFAEQITSILREIEPGDRISQTQLINDSTIGGDVNQIGKISK